MTHTLIITKIDTDPEYGRIEDEVDWSMECDGSCNLWMECSDCQRPDDWDGEPFEAHGEEHEAREGYWAVVNVRECAAVHIDAAVEAIGDWTREHHRYGDRPFEVGEKVAVELQYDGDDWWSVRPAPSTLGDHTREEQDR